MSTIVGRRVKIIKPEDSLGALGKTGLVVNKYCDGLSYLVKIKGWTQGHAGDTGTTSNEYWYFYRGALRVLPRRKRASR